MRVGETHLEEVILVHDAAVGQVLDQPVGQGGFPSIGYSASTKTNESHYSPYTGFILLIDAFLFTISRSVY